jgi:PadR family transcriptional regulator PadR
MTWPSVTQLDTLRVMRTTIALVQAASALMSRPADKHWGYELSRESGVRSGVMYRLLTRLLNEGWLSDGWEEDRVRGRPPRRYYQVTTKGQDEMTVLLAGARTDPRFAYFDWADTEGTTR